MSVLVSRKAPDFIAAAVSDQGAIIDRFVFSEFSRDQYTLLFFYPLDFTFVCPTELVALHHAMGQFKERKIAVAALSIDSQFTHNAWRNTSVSDGGIGPVNYTMVSDVTHAIARDYGIEHPEAGVAFRAAFVIDKKGMVRAEIVNDLPLGREIPEILRLFDALQFTDEHGDVCPANWKKGDVGMKATPKGVSQYLSDHGDKL